MNDTLKALLEGLALPEQVVTGELQALADTDNRYLKDFRINISNALKFPNLNAKESALLALAVAVNQKDAALTGSFKEMAEKEGASAAELAELYACVSIMNINNVFYRFRHFTNKEYYNTTPAGIKMSVMLNPVLGKEFFELCSLVLSAVNGCEMCVRAHEESVLKLGSSEARIYDAVRLGAIIKGATVLL